MKISFSHAHWFHKLAHFPFQCGIILGSLMLLLATWLTLVSCQLLLKAGITARRRSYSFLGKYLVQFLLTDATVSHLAHSGVLSTTTEGWYHCPQEVLLFPW